LYSNLGGLADCPEEVFSQLADHLLEGLNRWASYIAMHVPTGGHHIGYGIGCFQEPVIGNI
jgi:hypothetical protein